jgi:hypothetical protein
MSAAWPSAQFRKMQTRLTIDPQHLFILVELLHGDDENHMLGVIILDKIIDVRSI